MLRLKTACSVQVGPDGVSALEAALDEAGAGPGTDLLLVFASGAFAADFSAIAAAARVRAPGAAIAGCSGQGVIGGAREVEEEPAVSVLAMTLPGCALAARHVMREDLERSGDSEGWREVMAVPPDSVRGWLLFVDPFTMDADALVAAFDAAYPGVPVAGGLASGVPGREMTHLLCNGELYLGGAVAVAVGGDCALRAVVCQGAEPIGQAWTVTGASGNRIESIGNRPAFEVLAATVSELGPEQRERARTNLLAGLAIDERRDTFRRGDFVVRPLLGLEREAGVLTVAALPRAGQTVQFQLRDDAAAHDDLRAMLEAARGELAEASPVAALVCTCNGRGRALFGQPDHDARMLQEVFGAIPAAGFFCNGEIGSVGGRTFVHSFTATIGILVHDPR